MKEINVINVTNSNLEKGLVSASNNIRENGVKLAVYTAEYYIRHSEDMETSEIMDNIIALTSLSSATISTLKKAGELMIKYPFLQNAEYSKVYELRKIDDEDIEDFCSKYNIPGLSQKALRKAVAGYYIDTTAEEVKEEVEETEETEETIKEEVEETEETTKEEVDKEYIKQDIFKGLQAVDNQIDKDIPAPTNEWYHLTITNIYDMIEKL